MRITRQISGAADEHDEEEVSGRQGRGGYEWAGLQPEDPTREALFDQRVLLRLPDGILLDTACRFGKQGGKWRLARTSDARASRNIYPHYHATVALLMPWPTRTQQHMGRGQPVLCNEAYIVSDLLSGRVTVDPATGADYELLTVRSVNHTVNPGEDLDVRMRFAQVQKIWAGRARLSPELEDLLQEHETLVRGGDQISIDGQELVREIQAAATALSRELEIGACTPVTDCVPTLLEILGEDTTQAPPTPIEEISPEHLEIRRREIARQRRNVAVRGAAGTRFKQDVREAYRSTCVVCGLRLPRVWDNGSPGVDSAHILPWAQFDLDSVANGLCLCRLHHWAFDEGLVEIRHQEDSGYSIVVPTEARERAEEQSIDLAFLQQHEGVVPPGRLPASAAHHPSPECLRRLREMLYP